MKNIITLIFLVFSFSLMSQETRRIIDGNEFIIHSVKKGETLYGITQRYKVTKKEMRSSNSGMLLFIREGQELNIPVPLNERRMHLVKKGETLYGISRIYGISVDELVQLNPSNAKSINEGDKLVLRTDNSKPVTIDPIKPKEIPVQDNPVEINTANNKKKYSVKLGETLYGISRKFNITVDQLKALNPGISESINAGDVIWVPNKEILKEVVKVKPANDSSKIIEYTVKSGETFYGISKKYHTTVEAIKKSNPSIISLNEGDKLTIVLPPNYVNDIKVNLGDPQSTDSLNLDQINKINPLKDKLNNMVLKESYSVSLFLPLMLEKNAQIKVVANKPKRLNPDTETSTHFYQGVLIALDSIASSGVSIDLNVYDTKKDTAEVRKYLRTNEVKETDLIIGPFMNNTYKEVAKFSKSNGIQAVSPISVSNRLMHENMNVTMLNTSLPTQAVYLANYIAENRNTENVICIVGKGKQDKYLANSFSDNYNNAISGKTDNYRGSVSKFNMTSFSSMTGFDAKMVKGKKNIIILPLISEGLTTAFFTQLNVMMVRSRMRGYEVEIYALENFLKFDDIDTKLKLKFNVHVTSASYIDYKSDSVKDFVRKYRARFGTEPSKSAFMGFDAAIYHGVALSNFGKAYTAHYDKVQLPLLQSNYVLKRTEINSGFENQNVFILGYKDFELVKVN